jgi:hypothetical protein
MTASVDTDEHIAVMDWYRQRTRQRLEGRTLRYGSCVRTQYFRLRTPRTEKAPGHLDQVDLEVVESAHFGAAKQCIAVVENAPAV